MDDVQQRGVTLVCEPINGLHWVYVGVAPPLIGSVLFPYGSPTEQYQEMVQYRSVVWTLFTMETQNAELNRPEPLSRTRPTDSVSSHSQCHVS